jgi:hypothetical protein
MQRYLPYRTRQPKSKAHAVGSSLILLSLLLFTVPANAIGPYMVKNETVIDQGTSLEWQKNTSKTLYNWQKALAFCENLSIDSKNDWRLPNIRELKSLVDYNRYYPAIDSEIPCESSIYWSATSVASNTQTSAWSLFFGNGDDIWKRKIMNLNVRCVRTRLPQ